MKRTSKSERARVVSSPYAGVKSDFEKLLTKFTETNSIRYEQFAEIWRELKMSLMFSGRQSDKECREFVDACFQIAITFMMPPYNFQVRVGALYILYGIYLKQPCRPMNRVRVTPEQWKELEQLMAEVREQQHLDTEYVYTVLEYHKAFTLVATTTPMYPMMKEMVDDDTRLINKQDILTEQRSILSEILEPDNIDQLSAIHEQYHRVKCLLSNKTEPKTSLNVIKPSLVQYITKAVAAHEEKRKVIVGKKVRKRHDSRESGQTTTSESEAESDVDSITSKPKRQKKQASTMSRRAEIKARAFANVEKASKSRRHRQAVAESSQSQSEDFSPGSPDFSSPSPARAGKGSTPKSAKRKKTPKLMKQELDAVAGAEASENEEFTPLGAQLKSGLLSMPTLSEITSVEGLETPDMKKKGKRRPPKESKRGTKKKKTLNVSADPSEIQSPESVMITSPEAAMADGETTPMGPPAKKRGRKKKNSSESDLSTPQSATKGRGRPRKEESKKSPKGMPKIMLTPKSDKSARKRKKSEQAVEETSAEVISTETVHTEAVAKSEKE